MTNQRYGYQTSARHRLDPRLLVLRGGPLDGRTCEFVTEVGQRVFCGDGAWSTDGLYVVTAEIVPVDGVDRLVCVPAFA